MATIITATATASMLGLFCLQKSSKLTFVNLSTYNNTGQHQHQHWTAVTASLQTIVVIRLKERDRYPVRPVKGKNNFSKTSQKEFAQINFNGTENDTHQSCL